jgi:endonuclease YncB( thermonuclease family)
MPEATQATPPSLSPIDVPARPSRAPRPARRRRHRTIFTRARRRLIGGILLACLCFAALAVWERLTEPKGENRDGPVALCSGFQRRTCLIDGDTGRDNGKKWRLISIDTPELSEPECENERLLGAAARDRLRDLLAGGYRIRPNGHDDPHGRSLVDIELPDGRDVSRVLLDEGLAQKWPNRGNIWCDRYTGSPSRPRG